MEGDRDLNNNLLSSPSSSPLSKNNDKIPPTSPTLKISGKIKTETKTNNPPLKISSPQKVMSPKKLPVSISMPVLCSILWIFLCFIGTTNADQNQNRDQFAPQPGKYRYFHFYCLFFKLGRLSSLIFIHDVSCHYANK